MATCKVFPSCADLAAPLSSLAYVTPEIMGPQNCRDGKHIAAMIKEFRALHDNTHNAIHCTAIHSGTQEIIMLRRHNRTYISDEQLHAMELFIYDCIKVQVVGLEGECISQMCQYTGSQR
jgi:hypothetical protein